MHTSIHTAIRPNQQLHLYKAIGSVPHYRGKRFVSHYNFGQVYKLLFDKKQRWKLAVCTLNCQLLWEKWISTGKSLSEAFIFASTNPQYDRRLFIELHKFSTWKLQCWENFVTTIFLFFYFDIQNNLCTQYVLNMFWAWNFHVINL